MDQELRRINNRLVFKLAALAIAVSFLGIALIPFYDWICEVTGMNGKKIGRAHV